jgi:transcriptional regulator with XRE-family HTH domain
MSSQSGDGEPIDWARWMRQLGRQTRCIREFLGMSQEQLAKLAGVSQGAVSRLEAGRGLSTPILVAVKISAALARGLRALDPAILRDDVRRLLEYGPPLGDEFPAQVKALASDPDLIELVGVYRSLPEDKRRTFMSVVTSAWSAFLPVESRPAARTR